MTSAFSWQNSITFALLHSVLQGQICLLLQVFLNFLLCILVLYNKKDIFFCVLVLEGLVGLHRPFNFNLFSITSQGIDLDFYDIECFALEMNRGHSVIFEIVFKYCILNSFLLTMRATPVLLRDSCPQ